MLNRIKKTFFGLLLVVSSISQVMASTVIQGYVYVNKPIISSVKIRDANNKFLKTITNSEGFYQQDVSELTPPLIVFSNENSLVRTGDSAQTCNGNCLVSYVHSLQKDRQNTVNINPLTDFLASELAKQVNLLGPEECANNQ